MQLQPGALKKMQPNKEYCVALEMSGRTRADIVIGYQSVQARSQGGAVGADALPSQIKGPLFNKRSHYQKCNHLFVCSIREF